MPEWGMLPIPTKLVKQGVRDMLRLSDARMSGTSYGACILHCTPEAFIGGPLALVKTGDLITVDVPARRIHLEVSDEELARRRALWVGVTAGGVIGIFQRNQFDFGVFSIDFRDLVFLGNFGDRRGFFKEGQRVGLAGIRRDDRIPVQIIKLLAGFRIGTLGSKFRFRHYKPRVNSRI
jgi:hypothetical protein